MNAKRHHKFDYRMSTNREALASIIKTSSAILRLSDRFFAPFGTTDIQFNILMILKNAPKGGISQQALSEKLVVTKSNVVGLVDRMEKQGLVKRQPHPTDRRFNQIVISQKGGELVQKVEAHYDQEVDRMMAELSESEKKAIIEATDKVREFLKKCEEESDRGTEE